MKLGDVLRRERERKKLSPEDVAAPLGVSVEAYQMLESGTSSIEEWGPKLAQVAIKLSVPTSRLISQTGRSAQANTDEGQCGRLIRLNRESRQLSLKELALKLEWPVEQLASIESGTSQLEKYAPLLLRFAEVVDQPIFNLFYPCGLPFERLENYP